MTTTTGVFLLRFPFLVGSLYLNTCCRSLLYSSTRDPDLLRYKYRCRNNHFRYVCTPISLETLSHNLSISLIGSGPLHTRVFGIGRHNILCWGHIFPLMGSPLPLSYIYYFPYLCIGGISNFRKWSCYRNPSCIYIRKNNYNKQNHYQDHYSDSKFW